MGYITANIVMNLAARAREIFESSEVDEKRELLNLVFQNLKLEGKKMLTEVREPFSTMIGYKEYPTNWRWRESNSRPYEPEKAASTCIVSRSLYKAFCPNARHRRQTKRLLAKNLILAAS